MKARLHHTMGGALCAMALCYGGSAVMAAPLMFRWDAPAEAAVDSGPSHLSMEWRNPADQSIQMEGAKFGPGCLRRKAPRKEFPNGMIWQPLSSQMPELQLLVEKMTLACWVHLPAIYDGEGFMLVRRDVNHSEAHHGVLSFGYNGNLRALRFHAEGNRPVSARAMLHPGNWTHLAMTYERGRVVFYLNGEPLKEAETGAEGIPEVSASGRAGLFKALGGLPEGALADDLYIDLEEALSPEALRQLVEKGSAAFSTP